MGVGGDKLREASEWENRRHDNPTPSSGPRVNPMAMGSKQEMGRELQGVGCPEHGLDGLGVGSTDSRKPCLLGPTDFRESQRGVL